MPGKGKGENKGKGKVSGKGNASGHSLVLPSCLDPYTIPLARVPPLPGLPDCNARAYLKTSLVLRVLPFQRPFFIGALPF